VRKWINIEKLTFRSDEQETAAVRQIINQQFQFTGKEILI
jgi:hypothetical protein